jgi:hypothetical protein
MRRKSAAALALTAAFGLAACASNSKTPGVASLSATNSPGSTTTVPVGKGSATQLLDQWAQCMRQHGVPTLADPVVDANGTIHITLPPGLDPSGYQMKNSACQSLLTAASTALRGGQPIKRPDPSKLLAFSQCMRAHGLPDFPDPTGNGLSISSGPGSDLNPNSSTFQAAQKLCASKVGVPNMGGGPQRGGIEIKGGGGLSGGAAPGGGGGAVTGAGARP